MTVARSTKALVAVAVGALTLTGCGLGGADKGTDAKEAINTTKALSGEITFQTLALKPTFDEFINERIATFEAANPGTKIIWEDISFDGAQEKVSTAAQAGNMADIVNLNPNFAQPLEREGFFLDVTAAAPGAKAGYVEGAWNAFSVPGQEGSFGIPWYLTSEITMYNTALFEAAGLPADVAPKTQDELYAAAATVAASSGGAVYGMHPALENRFIVDLAKLGVPLISDDFSTWTFNTPEAVAHLDRLKDMYDKGVFSKDSLTENHQKEREAYMAGSIALFPSGPNFLLNIEKDAPAIFATTEVAPQITGENGVSNMSVMGLLIPNTSKNKELALAFALFMTNDESQLGLAKLAPVIPSSLGSLAEPYFADDSDGTITSRARKISAEQIKNAENLVPVQFDDAVKAVVIENVQKAILGQMTSKEALDDAAAKATEITAKSQG